MACCILISGIIGVLLSIKALLLDRRRSKNIALQWRLNPERLKEDQDEAN